MDSEGSPDPAAEDLSLNKGPVGFQLAPDVRLPVAAMPVDFKISPIARTALEQIVTDYYQELAAGLAAGAADDVAAKPGEDAGGETTVVVTNGPVANAARQRADSRFKALFGHAAYNRMTIHSLLESRLPEQAAE